MLYKIRVILDTEEDVIRDLAIHDNATLEELHKTIVNAFGFDGSEMASFYMTDNQWIQGEEIPLFDMSDANDTVVMQNFFIKDILKFEQDKLIYVYDFFSMWSFFVELISISEDTEKSELPKLLIAVGTVPKIAPEKQFKSEKLEASDEEFGEFEDLDDFDFDEFVN